MLNRIYIVVGLVAIIVLAGAFIAPRFIQWSDYRDRMEVLASGVLGAEVTIGGDIEFSLLPQPRLVFSKVIVGPADHPAASVAGVEAEFALMNFLRDRYDLTRLVLREPVVSLDLDDSGLLSSGVDLSGAGGGVALDMARIENGRVDLSDARSGERYSVGGITGDLRLSSFAGPFQFQGRFEQAGEPHEIRVNSGAADVDGTARFSAFLARIGGAYSLNLDGALTAGMAPKFDGLMVFRQAPPPAATAEQIRGHLVLESKVTASTDRIVLNGYTLLPDENRAGMRLTGAASVQLGARRGFEAVVSGGVFSLPPRDAAEVASEMPYELVRLLSELPAPPLPPMPGQLGVDLAEIGLRGAALRNVRIDASFDGSVWQIARAGAELAGNTSVSLTGVARNIEGAPAFNGTLSLASARLDAFSQLWRRAREDSPLINMGGRLEGQVMLGADAFGFSHGRLTLNGKVHAVELRLGFGDEPRLDLVGRFDDLGPVDSAALGALFPDPASDATFGISFPQGSFALNTQSIRLLGFAAEDLIAEGIWSPGQMRLNRLVSSDFGGIGLDLSGVLSGTLAQPGIAASGRVRLDSGGAPALAALYDLVGFSPGWRTGVSRFAPFDLRLDLTPAADDGAQVLTLDGAAGAATLNLRADMAKGLGGLAQDNLLLSAALEAEDGAALMAQFGLERTAPFAGEDAMLVSLFAKGSAPDGFDARLAASQGEETAAYVGSLALGGNGELSGTGTLDVRVEDGSALARLAGIAGLGLGPFEASADLRFAGAGSVSLSGITGVSGASGFGGAIEVASVGQLPSVSGGLSFDHLAAEHVAASLLSPAAMVGVSDIWPQGPLAAAMAPRVSRGALSIETDRLGIGSATMDNAAFELTWGPETIGVSRLSGDIGGGIAVLDMTLCCAGPLTDRVLSGRLSLTDIDLSGVLPDSVSNGLSGHLGGGLQFEGTGASLAEVMDALTGEGNFILSQMSIRQLSPGVYPAASGLDDMLNTEADALEVLLAQNLGQGAFEAESATGAFTIAGGTLRLANVLVEGSGARLAGGINLALASLGLNGSFVMTPFGYDDPSGLIEPDAARIIARLSGTLLSPLVSIDLGEMVAAIQVRANELEVDRLEALRLEDEARQRAAAEERNRLIEEQRRQAAEAAARRAAEEEALRLEQDRLLQQQAPQAEPPPFTFQLQPGFNLNTDPLINLPR